MGRTVDEVVDETVLKHGSRLADPQIVLADFRAGLLDGGFEIVAREEVGRVSVAISAAQERLREATAMRNRSMAKRQVRR